MKKTMLLAVCAAALVGCNGAPPAPTIPMVNDENCQISVIKKIEDKGARETFAGMCSRRQLTGGGIAPTQRPMNWLELAGPRGVASQGATP
jgi:entry exclusion lipoprotein TrbK